MGKIEDLPFKAGQMAEARSFLLGYRGAWFRCKIKDITKRKGETWHALEYFDFPDEKIKWTKLYQVGPGKSRDIKKHLMVRPRYPTLYKKNESPGIISEVTVITDGFFRIGDLVDWWQDDCYWSAKVTKILSNDMLEIELPPPPLGEGYTYEVGSKDLRPSLDWSPEFGWKVPSSTGSEKGGTCASLIQPGDQAAEGVVNSVDKGTKDFDGTAGCSFTPSLSSHVSLKNRKRKDKPKQSLNTAVSIPPEPNTDLQTADYATEKIVMLDSVSSSRVTRASPETALNTAAAAAAAEDDRDSSGSLKRLREVNDTIPLNSTRSDSIEAAIFDLEEIVNKVKWLKNILEFGIPLPNHVKPAWKFVEHRPSSTPK